MVRPSVDPETLTELSGEDPPELVSPEHVDDEVGRGVDGQQHVRDGDDLLDRRCGLTGRILLEREGRGGVGLGGWGGGNHSCANITLEVRELA